MGNCIIGRLNKIPGIDTSNVLVSKSAQYSCSYTASENCIAFITGTSNSGKLNNVTVNGVKLWAGVTSGNEPYEVTTLLSKEDSLVVTAPSNYWVAIKAFGIIKH